MTAPDMLFNYSEDLVPVIIRNTGDDAVTVYKITTLGTSEIVPKEHIQNVGYTNPKTNRKLNITEPTKNTT